MSKLLQWFLLFFRTMASSHAEDRRLTKDGGEVRIRMVLEAVRQIDQQRKPSFVCIPVREGGPAGTGSQDDLKAAGFTADEIEVLTGEEGARRIDVNGGEHGVLAHIVRSILKTLGEYEIPHAKRHEQELLAGHFGIGVIAKQEEHQKKVRGILKSHNGHFINFYGTWTMQNLEP
jgi:hypothetical protein